MGRKKTYHAMTVQEYIDKNLPFYHITPAINKYGILRDGLHCGKAVKAICVVRSDDKDIWRDIAESQLSAGGKHNEFIVIKLLPRTHGIKAIDVAQDTIQERTSPLHNYIVKEVINVAEGDFIDNLSIKEEHGKPVDKYKIQSLTGYLREGLPMLSDELKRILGED